MSKQVNKTSKKEDIWDAYNDLLSQLEQKENEEPLKKQQAVQQQEVVKVASEFCTDTIIKGIAELKASLSGSLDKLEDSLINEFRKLETIRKAIVVEKKQLEDLYSIQTNAHSLTALIMLQREKKDSFEKEIEESRTLFEEEMKSQRELWKNEVEETEKKIKEKKAETEKLRKREEEEYQYNLAIERKKELDVYLEKQTILEKQLIEKEAEFEKKISEREASVTAAESELIDLRKKVQNHPKELEAAVKSTEQSVIGKLTSQFEFEKQLNAKQIEGDMKLKDQTIVTLKEKIKDLEASLKEQTQKAIAAETGVKDIAMKAIESSSKMKIIETQSKSSD